METAPPRSVADVLDHRFDLLGSGPVVIAHGAEGAGLEGCRFPSGPRVEADAAGAWLHGRVPKSNLTESRRIWSLIDPGYVPIDWQLDARSGFRWTEVTWYRRVKIGEPRCADVKLPWELSRMQHLPQLAVSACQTRDGGSGAGHPATTYVREFRNEVLDFVASNPPRFGVNWVAAMEVAIRAANWLLAYDLFVSAGTRFDDGFEAVFVRSIYEHGRHIAANLEWSLRRGNHYLADVVGLIFVASYLPRSHETDEWLDTGRRELLAEIDRQFLGDGGHFEGSTSYHRLATELVVYGLAALLGLDEERRPTLPEEMAERLHGMADFVLGITKPDGHVPQVGDNDSGRFFKVSPILRLAAGREVEDHLDLRHVVAVVNALAPDPRYQPFAGLHELEAGIVRAIARGRTLGPPRRPRRAVRLPPADPAALDQVERWISERPPAARRLIEIPVPPGALGGLVLSAFPEFGLYVARSPRIYLTIRCGTPHQGAPTGHLHNDQLSIELTVDDMHWIRDPGSYVYTPLPERRNAYRSAEAHFGPRPADAEPARLDDGLFRVPNPPVVTCVSWSAVGFAGRAELADGRILACTIRWPDSVIVLRWGSGGCDLAGPDDGSDWRSWLPNIPFSPGYGIQDATT